MRRIVATLAVLAALGGLGAVAVVGLGLYNVSARVGHMPGVSWVLHTTFRNSVRLRAPPPEAVPDNLGDPAMIELGARHYDAACRTCHAAPGQDRTATMAAMVPAPPHIGQAVKDWQPRHLHWIVANGIKMSGMPPWPAARSDDVWPVVAFLQAVQSGLDGNAYAALTARPDAPSARAGCLACHGAEGPRTVPRLDIQSAAYLRQSLDAYRSGARPSGIMAQAASQWPEATLHDLADWFAAQRPSGNGTPMPPGLVERGRALSRAATGDPDVPACRACHGPGATEPSPLFPSLAGLPGDYLRDQLHLWREGRRGGGARAHLMHQVAQDLTDDAIAALAAYYASLPATKRD